MGSGKSTLLQAIHGEEPKPQTELIVTYRQTQARDAAGKNRDFSHYEDLKQARARQAGTRLIEPLADRELYPRVICQVDSLPGLLAEDEDAPAFDLLVLDESESILAHLSADTLRERHVVVQLIVELMRRARRVICMDGHLGQRTFDFLMLHKIACAPVLINKHAPERPLEFEFLEGPEGRKIWENGIFEALGAARNVFVVSMSSDKARDLGATVADRGLVEDGQILIVTRHSDGEVKRGLQDVNAQWTKRLVIISPTVEAGVDFNQPWFHHMFLYICAKSTHPRGLDQMKGRVRKLEDPLVLCYVQQGIRLPTKGPPEGGFLTEMSESGGVSRLGLEETYQWFLNQDQRGGQGVNCAGPITRLLAHNEKEIFNGRTHFYEEFTGLLQSDGHVVKGVRVEESVQGEALEVNLGPCSEEGPARRGKFLLEEMVLVPNITTAEFAQIEARVRKNQDREGERVQMEKYQLAKFYAVPHPSESFLRTVGPYPIQAVEFLVQVVDQGYSFDEAEIGRPKYPPQMAVMARELFGVMGFAHPLDYAHETPPLETLKPTLAGTAFFREYSENVKLFHVRAQSTRDVLASQKLATIALNHVFSALGLRLKAKKLGRRGVNDAGEGSVGGRRVRTHRYGGWFLARDPWSSTRPVVGPPGVNLMAQLMKLRLEDSRALKGRVPAALREYVDGLQFKWPELVQHDECMIDVGPRGVD
jgi:hypothetical protein